MRRSGFSTVELRNARHGHTAPPRGIDQVLDPTLRGRVGLGATMGQVSAGSLERVIPRDWSDEPMKVMRYLDQQQRAKLIIPIYPVHSRLDELDRVHDEIVHHEDWRLANNCACEIVDRARANRLKLRLEAAREHDAAKRIFSSSAPRAPPGDDVATTLSEDRAVRLLSRHVDVNNKRKSQEKKKKHQDHLASTAALAMDLDYVVNEIEDFEISLRRQHFMTRDNAGQTALDWTGTRPVRVPCAARQRAALCPAPISPSDTLPGGWLSKETTQLVPDMQR